MKKYLGWLALGIILVYGFTALRGLQSHSNTVENAWAQVENQLQRRYDLIPNLVETVKGYASHEKSLFVEVTEARSKVGTLKIDIANATPEQMQEFSQAQGELATVLSKLLLVRENYPQLKANENFLKLQDELAGTENRIAVERKRYNDEVKVMNNKVTVIPSSIVASLFGFQKLSYFEIDSVAKNNPKVSF
ncbi:MAG: LemA family protein [Arcobacteraceae bacterium]